MAAIAAVRSIAAFVGVSLWVILFAPIGVVLALLFRWTNVLYILGRGGVRLGLAAAGLRVEVEGVEWIRPEHGTVYCANHSSNLEPPIIYLVLAAVHPRLKILYKAELRRAIPLLRTGFDVAGFVPIERSNVEQSGRAIDRAAAALASGDSFMIFPEGTRSRTGELLPFKTGGFVMAIKGGAPVAPIAITGAGHAMGKGSPLIRPVTIRVRIGQPIQPGGATPADRRALIRQTRESIETMLLGARGETPRGGCTNLASDEEGERPGRERRAIVGGDAVE